MRFDDVITQYVELELLLSECIGRASQAQIGGSDGVLNVLAASRDVVDQVTQVIGHPGVVQMGVERLSISRRWHCSARFGVPTSTESKTALKNLAGSAYVALPIGHDLV